MSAHELVTLLSLGLTPMTIITSIMLIFIFYIPFIRALEAKEKKTHSWLVIGIVIGFIGNIFDNLCWGFAWSSDYINTLSAMKSFFFKNCVYSNTVFRQLTGITAACCHIYSASTTENKRLKYTLYFSAIIGILFVVLLMKISVN